MGYGAHLAPVGGKGAVHTEAKGRYIVSRLGSMYIATEQTPTDTITGGTSFVATAPMLFLRNPSSSAKRLVLSRLTLVQTGTVAGGAVHVALVLDTTDRFASGGTAVTPVNPNGHSSIASAATMYDNGSAITVSAAGAGTRLVLNDVVDADLNTVSSYDLEDAIITPVPGSFLVYAWAATTGPTFKWALEWYEESVS